MSIQKLERVLWRLRKRNKGQDKVTNTELRRAIMHEIGTSPQCYGQNRRALKQLGWITANTPNYITMTNKDLEGNS